MHACQIHFRVINSHFFPKFFCSKCGWSNSVFAAAWPRQWSWICHVWSNLRRSTCKAWSKWQQLQTDAMCTCAFTCTYTAAWRGLVKMTAASDWRNVHVRLYMYIYSSLTRSSQIDSSFRLTQCARAFWQWHIQQQLDGYHTRMYWEYEELAQMGH